MPNFFADSFKNFNAAGAMDIRSLNAVHELSGVWAVGDIVILGEIPVDAVIHKVELSSDALGVGGAVNIGLYEAPAPQSSLNPNAAVPTLTTVSANYFASAVSVASAQADVNVTYEQTPADIDKIATPLNARASLVAAAAIAPNGKFLVGIVPTTATTTAGTVAVRVTYGTPNC